MPQKKHLIFISHDAQPAGAPILLLRFLKQLHQLNQYEITVILKADGPLAVEFKSISELLYWNTPPKFLKSDTLTHFIYKLGLFDFFYKIAQYFHQKDVISKLKSKPNSLIIANTIATGDVLQHLGKLNYPVVSYIHELESAYDKFSKPKLIDYQLNISKYIWAPSQAVLDFLIKKYKVNNEKTVVLSTITAQEIVPKPKKQDAEGTITVGAVGTFDYRKGYDLFLQIGKILNDKQQNIKLIWVGAEANNEHREEARMFVKNNNLTNIEIFDRTNNVHKFYEKLDMLLLCSREDPYPLVVLEAAQYQLPIICFDKQAGGAADFVSDDSGLIVPYLNVNLMADAIIRLSNDVNLRKKLGESALNKVSEKHSPQKGTNQLVTLIEQAFD